MPKKNIAWLRNDWDSNSYRRENDLYGGIGYYRVVKPAQALEKWYDIEVIGEEFQHWGTEDEKYTRFGRDYDLIISKHLRTGKEASDLLATAKHYNKKVLVDIDDDYLNMRKDNPAFSQYQKGEGGRYFVSAMLELADGMIVSTEPLKKLYTKFNQEIDVLPNCCDVNDWPKERNFKNDGMVRIGYAGGGGHTDDLKLIEQPIANILKKYPNVLFEIMGAVTPDQAREMGARMLKFAGTNILSRFRFTGSTKAWQGYPQALNSHGWDIVIAPLVDEPFNRGKSHIRWLEASLIGAATIASPVYPYKEDIQGVRTIVDGVTGMFADTSDEWFNKLEFLVKDEILRKSLAKNAYNYIKKYWQYKNKFWTDKWRKVLNKYL